MQKIEKTKLLDEKYISNNYLYYIKNLSNETLYYIFMCNGIISNSPLVYSTNKCYCFSLPKNVNKKTYLYDDVKNVEILPHSDLYFITFSEFVDKFRIYIENDGEKINNINENIL